MEKGVAVNVFRKIFQYNLFELIVVHLFVSVVVQVQCYFYLVHPVLASAFHPLRHLFL